jgi:hypothetical protein
MGLDTSRQQNHSNGLTVEGWEAIASQPSTIGRAWIGRTNDLGTPVDQARGGFFSCGPGTPPSRGCMGPEPFVLLGSKTGA